MLSLNGHQREFRARSSLEGVLVLVLVVVVVVVWQPTFTLQTRPRAARADARWV